MAQALFQTRIGAQAVSETFSSRLYLILDSNPFGGLDNVSQDHHSQQRFPHLLKRATGLGTIEKLMHHEDQLAVTESGPRAHSYIVSSEAQKTCQFWLLTLWLLTFWVGNCSLRPPPSASIYCQNVSLHSA